jgi:Tfp pilus assembly protein PilO
MTLNLKKLDTKQKIALNILATLIIVLIIIYFVYIPTIENIKEQRLNILNQRMEVEKMYNDSKTLKILKEKLEKIEPQLQLLDNVFINQNRELEFITALESVANKNNVAQKITLNPEIIEADKPYKITPIEFKLTGAFRNLLNYLIDIETLTYYINVSALNIQANSDSAVRINSPRSESQSPEATSNSSKEMTLKLYTYTYWK